MPISREEVLAAGSFVPAVTAVTGRLLSMSSKRRCGTISMKNVYMEGVGDYLSCSLDKGRDSV